MKINLIILGPQGSGKGTQAELLAKRFNLVHVDMGFSLRKAAFFKTSYGKKLNEIINKKKELVPDEIVRKVLEQELKNIPRSKGVIVDGSPRRKNQIEEVEKSLAKFGRKIKKVIFINISKQESVERISRRYSCLACLGRVEIKKKASGSKSSCPVCGGRIIQRADDTPAGVRKRLNIFRKETMPVIREFRKRGILIEVNGEKTTKQVFKEILKEIRRPPHL